MDDGVDIIVINEVFSDFLLCAAAIHDAWETDDGRGSVGGEPCQGVHDKREVGLGFGGEDAGGRKTRIVDQQGVVVALPFDGIGGIGHDQFKGLIVPVLWRRQRVFTGDAEFIEPDVVQKHVDSAKVVRRDVDLLPVESIPDGLFAEDFFRFEQQGTGTACRVVHFVDFGFSHRTDSGQQFRHIGRRKELAAGFSGRRGVHGHQVFVGVAKGIDVVIFHIAKVHVGNAVQEF